MDRKHCVGCEDNFYNGNNPYGIKSCWGLESAKVILRKQVSIDQRPPWDQKPVELPSCYHKKRYIFVKPEQMR